MSSKLANPIECTKDNVFVTAFQLAQQNDVVIAYFDIDDILMPRKYYVTNNMEHFNEEDIILRLFHNGKLMPNDLRFLAYVSK